MPIIRRFVTVCKLTTCVCYFVSALAAPFMEVEVTLESTINLHFLVKISLAEIFFNSCVEVRYVKT